MSAQIQNPSGTSAAQDAFLETMNRMNLVISQMKEIPVLPSEAPKDEHALTKVEFPDKGGIYTYMEGYDYPYRGFPFGEFVDKIDTIKKLTRGILSGLFHGLKGKKYLLITLFPTIWCGRIILSAVIYAYLRLIERFRIKRVCYCDAIRELHRAFSMERNKEDEKTRVLRLQLRDVVCMILEFDNAYRYRFQDIVAELDQVALRKNAIGELTRLLSLMQTREKGQDISDTWKLLKLFVKFYCRVDKEFTRMIRDVLSQLDLKLIELKVEDQYFCKPRKDYAFGFQAK